MAEGQAIVPTCGLSQWIEFLTMWWCPQRESLEGWKVSSVERTKWKPHDSMGQGCHNLSRINTKGHGPHALIGWVPKNFGVIFYRHHTEQANILLLSLEKIPRTTSGPDTGWSLIRVGEEGRVDGPSKTPRVVSLKSESTLPQDGHPRGVSAASNTWQMKRILSTP